MKTNYFGYISMLIIVFVLILGVSVNPSKGTVPDTIAKNTIYVSKPQDPLYEEIQKFGEENNIPPIDARVDTVWKAIPGYNGLEVDVKASYKKMKSGGKFDDRKIIYRDISPNIHLEDLDPHPIFKGNPEKPMIAFLINVAWGNEYIPAILKALDKHETFATFFFDGSWVKKNPELTKMIYEAGHEIGNHAYSHPDLQKRSEAETLDELRRTNDVIRATIGVTPKWFGPPSGSFNQTTVNVARDLGMYTILWTVDTVDWRKPATTEMVNRVVSKVENGSMVLMHPTKPVAEGLEAMITNIKEKGFQLGTVAELMSEERVEAVNEKAQ